MRTRWWPGVSWHRDSPVAGWVLATVTVALLLGPLGVAAGAQESPTTEPAPPTTTAPTPPTTGAPTPPTTAPAPTKLGNYPVVASVGVHFCPTKGCAGERVFIDSASNHYGSKGYSNCTKDETSTDFVQTAEGQRRDVGMTAKDEGSCRFEPSYNVWLIAAYQGQQLISQGLVYVGQTTAGLPYSAQCRTFHLTKNFSCSSSGLSLEVGRADQPPPPPPPACPSSGVQCFITLHFDTNLCPNFTASVGACTGTAKSNSIPFQAPYQDLGRGFYAAFSWGPNHIFVKYGTLQGFVPFALIDGKSGNGPNTEFRVSDAFALASPYPGVHWYTPDRRGVPAGEPGGPLLLSFKNGTFGADVYIRGYLERKP
jgi:hypothetical protein